LRTLSWRFRSAAQRNHVRQALDFVNAAKTTLFASELEKVQDGLFQQPASAEGAALLYYSRSQTTAPHAWRRKDPH
jgi:hypothetical protein